MAGKTEGVERGVATHEADGGPLDTRAERQPLDQRKVHPGAANPVQETRSRCVMSRKSSSRSSAAANARSAAPALDAHARAGVGKTPRDVEPRVVELAASPRRQHRMPPLDAAALDHALEQAPVAPALQHSAHRPRTGHALVRRDRGPDGVQVSARSVAHAPSTGQWRRQRHSWQLFTVRRLSSFRDDR